MGARALRSAWGRRGPMARGRTPLDRGCASGKRGSIGPARRHMSRLHNRTRTSASIPRKLLRSGKVHLLPVYALMRTSDLAREGIENSGSYRFADHVYRNEASGRFGIV